MSEFDASRRETIRYHEALYAESELAAGSWLSRPHPLVVQSLGLVSGPVHAYDVGAGLGRHTLLMASRLPAGSRVTAVDLLSSALRRLTADATKAGLGERIDVIDADLERFQFPAQDAGLIVAFSAVEHVSSLSALTDLLARCRNATQPGGLNVIAIFADRREVTAHGERPALIECPLTSRQARDTLGNTYRGWDVLVDTCSPARAAETRDGEAYELRSALVQFLARAPAARRPLPAR